MDQSNLGPGIKASKARVGGYRLDWLNITFVTLVHVVAIVAIAYSIKVQFSWWTVGLTFVWWAFSGISITGGYHRLFSHRAYECHALLRLFYLLFGAAALQHSALRWCINHRLHHAYTDRDADPYNIKKGFWWAHIGWVLHKSNPNRPSNVKAPDLAADPLVRFQDRHYVLLVAIMAFALPTAVGFAWGDPIGVLLWVVGIRLVILYHSTYTINSIAHSFGKQSYSTKNSSRDSLIAAIISFGEGYHSFHHRFPSDYRNGIRFFHFDPCKWWISLLSKFGLTWNLKRTPKERIEAARKEALADGQKQPTS